MNERLAILTDSELVQTTLRDVDTLRLFRELGVAANGQNGSTASASRLRVAATIALADLLGETTVDDYLKQAAPTDATDSRTQIALTVFRKWCGYFDAMVESRRSLTADDLMFFATAGLIANRPTDVRSVLRQAPNRNIIEEAIKSAHASEWSRRVRATISVSLLLLVLQADYNDVAQAGRLLQNLAKDQRQFESEWLNRQPDSSRDALALLGYYHLGQAVVRTSEFLLLGSVTKNGRVSEGFGPELARLLVKAEEYFALSNQAETVHWLRAVSILLWRLRTDSIWVSGLGISERLDQLIKALAREAREQPVFSLLPSQQEALRKNLLDPTRVAVILQMPTSAGKTLLAEFAIVQAFEAYRHGTKVVYVVPTRALATQVRRTLA